jgi:DNA repair protein RadC
VVDCKLIIKRAIELLASQIVLVHNHPSGSVEPSRQDIELTERVSEASKLFDIRLLDHVIIAHGAHYSFRANGIVK